MAGKRKFIISLASLACYTAIMILVPNLPATELGLGLGFLIAPNAAAAVFEYKYKSEKV